MENLEEKTFPFELKEIDEKGTFEGYAAIFNKPDALNEIVEPGAFTKTLKEKSFFPMCWYHDPRNPIGIVYLVEDAKGLKVKGELNLEVQSAREKYELMKQKAIQGLSFGFRTVKDFWDDKTRRLKEVKLYEVSPCTFQAHPKALISAVKSLPPESLDIAVKALEDHITVIEEFKVDKVISAANVKSLNNAVQALVSLLKASEPSTDTQKAEKSDIIPITLGSFGSVLKPHTHFMDAITIPKNEQEV